ncbi:hypothetical protein COO60DRAFT_642294 [Scenedesmus sp. NREL 46B-D3]|nr:hypothetical protein COO60DRAFT_642294 [Scenedesmus sp. NREL 46B-D3]
MVGLPQQSNRDQEQLHELRRMISSTTSFSPAAAATANTAAAFTAQQPPAASQEPGSVQPLLQRSLSSAAATAAASSFGAAAPAVVASSYSFPELPQAPAHLPASVGVLVEEGPGCFLVRVNCRDRHGLLSDIASALGGLPLQVGCW